LQQKLHQTLGLSLLLRLQQKMGPWLAAQMCSKVQQWGA
jgi:hypothetical protein